MITDKMSGKPSSFPEDIDDTYVHSEMKEHRNSHYSRCIENQLDAVRLPFAHRSTIGRGGYPQRKRA